MLKLRDLADMQPKDGWELITWSLGVQNVAVTPPAQLPPAPTPVGNPYLVLYNKYTSNLRVVAVGNENRKTSLQFSNDNANQSSVLDYSAPLQALTDLYTRDKVFATSVDFINDYGKWMYSDFPMYYDPCTCKYPFGSLLVTVRLNKTSNITLNGVSNGQIKPIVTNGDVDDTQQSKSLFAAGKQGLEAGKKVVETMKTTTDWRDKQLDALKYMGKTPTEIEAIKNSTSSSLNLLQKAFQSSSFLRGGLKALPYIGTALSLVDAFLGEEKKVLGHSWSKLLL